MSPRSGRLGILTVITRKRVASPYRALIFSGRLEPCIAAGGHVHPRPRRSPRVRPSCAENDRRQSKWDPGSPGAITSVACRAKTKTPARSGAMDVEWRAIDHRAPLRDRSDLHYAG